MRSLALRTQQIGHHSGDRLGFETSSAHGRKCDGRDVQITTSTPNPDQRLLAPPCFGNTAAGANHASKDMVCVTFKHIRGPMVQLLFTATSSNDRCNIAPAMNSMLQERVGRIPLEVRADSRHVGRPARSRCDARPMPNAKVRQAHRAPRFCLGVITGPCPAARVWRNGRRVVGLVSMKVGVGLNKASAIVRGRQPRGGLVEELAPTPRRRCARR